MNNHPSFLHKEFSFRYRWQKNKHWIPNILLYIMYIKVLLQVTHKLRYSSIDYITIAEHILHGMGNKLTVLLRCYHFQQLVVHHSCSVHEIKGIVASGQRQNWLNYGQSPVQFKTKILLLTAKFRKCTRLRRWTSLEKVYLYELPLVFHKFEWQMGHTVTYFERFVRKSQ